MRWRDRGLRAANLLTRAARWARSEWREWRAPASRILRDAVGYVPAGGRAVCLYASFAESGRVSEMVLRQLEEYTLLGFDVVFVTTSRDIPPDDWEAVRARCTLVLQRRNYGLDFGSWSDAAREVRDRILDAEELLVTNDSLLGPIRPLAPVFATLRSGGDGLFGLTESLQHAVHLQSYLLLARGKGAVADLLGFLLDIRLSARKTAIIRRGELVLSGHMAKRGHRVAALYGYADLEAAMLADRVETRRLLEDAALHRGDRPAAGPAPCAAATGDARRPAEPDAPFLGAADPAAGFPLHQDGAGDQESGGGARRDRLGIPGSAGRTLPHSSDPGPPCPP